MVRQLVVLLPLALLVACGGDSDGDGLSNKDERALGFDPAAADGDGDGIVDADEAALGLDPAKADTDDDGLTDGEEIELGTDPTLADTDGDTMSDGDEVLYGRNPLKRKVGPYEGGWPMLSVSEKDEIEAGRAEEAVIRVGARFPRFKLTDQFGDKVDLYDFAMQGKKILLDMSALNCPPCIGTAEWLDSEEPSSQWWGAEGEQFDILRDGVHNGDIYWVTFAYTSYYPPSRSDEGVVAQWYAQFPTPNVPVLADEDLAVWDYAWPGGMPAFALLNEKMIVKAVDMGFSAGVAPIADAIDSLE